MKKVIVISSHPDDETLGVGGTLLRHKAEGNDIYWIIVTNVFENIGYSQEIVDNRQNEIDIVSDKYGFSKVFKLDYPTMGLSSSSLHTLIPTITEIFKEVKPNVIYSPNRSDAHSDHRITFEAVMACTKSFRYPSIKEVYMYECISETEFGAQLAENMFIPNVFVNITQFMDKKLEIMKVFKSELGNHPFPRSIKNIEAIAIFRGASSGFEYAEAFQLIKSIH